MKIKVNWMKVAGVALPILGAGLSLVTNIVDDKKLDDKVTNKIAEALQNKAEES